MEQLDQSEKERIIACFLCDEYGIDATTEIMVNIKETNSTITDYILQSTGKSIEHVFWDFTHDDTGSNLDWNAEGLRRLSFFGSFYLVNEMDIDDKKDVIVTKFNSMYGTKLTTVDDVIRTVKGASLEETMKYVGCSADMIIDVLFIELDCMKDILITENLLDLEQKYTSDYQNKSSQVENMIVKLPNGTEKTTNETVIYSITKNGTYMFEVTYKGKTTPYTINVTELYEERCLECGLYRCTCEPMCQICGYSETACQCCPSCGIYPCQCCPSCATYPCECDEE